MVRGFGDTGGDIAARLNYCNENFLYDDLFLNIYEFSFGLGFKCTKARATREVLQRFCTKYNDPPRYYAGPKPEFNEGLFDKVRKRVEIVLTDAAANELLASNVTRGARDPNIEGPGAQILLPCLKLVARDHAHAFRRVIQRPFKATDHLSALMAEHVLGANSPVRIIDGSFIFRQWFDDEVAKLVNGNVHCHNLKSATWMHFWSGTKTCSSSRLQLRYGNDPLVPVCF